MVKEEESLKKLMRPIVAIGVMYSCTEYKMESSADYPDPNLISSIAILGISNSWHVIPEPLFKVVKMHLSIVLKYFFAEA